MASSDGDNLRRKVFNYICGRGGIVPFHVLVKPPSPLSKMEAGEIVSWLNTEVEENLSPFFLQYQTKGKSRQIDSVRLRLKTRLCLTYLRSQTCRFGTGCKNFHICKAFVEGNCKDSAQCGLSHSFHDETNVGKLHDLGLVLHPDGALKNIIANSLPQVCKAYIEGSCQDRNCQSLHICDKFVQYAACGSETLPCKLSHELQSDHNSSLLKMFGLAGFKVELLICHILLPKGKRLKVEGGNPHRADRVDIPKENLNDLSGEKKTFDLLGEGPKKKERKGKGWHEPEVEASLKVNIGGESCLKNLMDSPSCGSQPGVRGGRNRGRGRRGKGKETAVSAPNSTEDSSQPGQQVDEKINECPAQKPQHKKKKEKKKKGKKGPQSGSEETVKETNDLIDLSEEPQSQSNMSLVDLSIDDMLSMDDTEKQNAPLSSADDVLDDWLGTLSGQTSTQGSTVDLLEAVLCEENTLGNTAGGPNERAVICSICKEYNGTVAFPVLAKRQDLFPGTTQESEKWLRSKPRKFLLLENERGEIEEVSVILFGARLCSVYQMKRGKCPKPDCYFFHLCKEYVISGTCSNGASCKLDHNLHSQHNQPLVKKLQLADFTDNQLRNLLIASGPQVCLDYNKFYCDKGPRCNMIHVCKDFVKRKCTSEEVCGLAHDIGLSNSHTKRVLETFHLGSIPLKAVFKMLMVCEDAAAVDDTQKELQMAEHVHHDLDTQICDRFILGDCRKGRGCIGHHCRMPYLWQYSASGGANQWESFDEAHNEDIENVYCDVNQVSATLTDISISSQESLL